MVHHRRPFIRGKKNYVSGWGGGQFALKCISSFPSLPFANIFYNYFHTTGVLLTDRPIAWKLRFEYQPNSNPKRIENEPDQNRIESESKRIKINLKPNRIRNIFQSKPNRIRIESVSNSNPNPNRIRRIRSESELKPGRISSDKNQIESDPREIESESN